MCAVESEVDGALARELVSVLVGAQSRYPELLSELRQLASSVDTPAPSSPSHPLQFTVTVQAASRVSQPYLMSPNSVSLLPTQLWYMAEISDLCLASTDSWLCGRVLAHLSLSDLNDIIRSPEFPKVKIPCSAQ